MSQCKTDQGSQEITLICEGHFKLPPNYKFFLLEIDNTVYLMVLCGKAHYIFCVGKWVGHISMGWLKMN